MDITFPRPGRPASEPARRGSCGEKLMGSPGDATSEAARRGDVRAGTVRRSGLALAALGLGAFTIGTAELLVVGVLPLVAHADAFR
jgi:hypothetical protein